MSKPRHQEFVHKKAVDLRRGDVLPARGHLGLTIDRVLPFERRRWMVALLRSMRLGWLAFGADPIRIRMVIYTQDGHQHRYRGTARVKLVSPTTGPVLVAAHPRTTYEADRRFAELVGNR